MNRITCVAAFALFLISTSYAQAGIFDGPPAGTPSIFDVPPGTPSVFGNDNGNSAGQAPQDRNSEQSGASNQNGGKCGRDRPFGTVIRQVGNCVLCQDESKWHSYSIHINGSDELFGTKFPNEAMQTFNLHYVQAGICN